MRMKRLSIVAVLGLFLALGRAALAQDLGPNLLKNAGFEEGHYNQDGIAEITVPNNWRMHWSNGERIFGGEWPSARPETVVWNIKGAPPGEEFFWKDGAYTMKIFKSWTPMWAAMSQDVQGLEVGRKYRLAVPIYIDVFEDFEGGRKIAPTRKDTGRVRLGASPVGAAWRDENAIKYSGWWTAETINPFYLAYPTFIYDFVATEPNMTVWIEMASTYPYPNNGFFFDTPGLYALNEVAPVAAPPPAGGQPAAPVAQVAPLPTIAPPTPRADGAIVHVVQSGDTLWTIAIRYAAALGKTAEETLPYLQELNNSPAFLNVGQELLIAPPGAVPAAAEPTTDPAAATPETTDAIAEAPPATEAAPVEAVAPEAAPEVAAEAPPAAGSICVAAFNDASADGARDANEELVPNAAIAVTRAGATVSTYITDGVSEPYCFQLAEPDTYQVQLYPPADFAPTTESNWAVAVANGEGYTVSFGLTSNAAVASTDTTAAGAVDEATQGTTETAEQSGSLFDNLGVIVLGAAGVLVLLAVIGVVLLRRG